MPQGGYAFYSMLDYDSELSTMSVAITELDAANMVAQIEAVDDLWEAVEAVSLGNFVKRAMGNQSSVAKAAAASFHAQRETKWLVRYTDNITGKPGKFEIPCADLELLDPNARKQMAAGAAQTALVAAIQAVVKSDVGNAITVVLPITHVGRNL